MRFVVVGNERLSIYPPADDLLPTMQIAFAALRLRDYSVIEAEVRPEPGIVRALPNPSLARDGAVARAAAAAGVSYTDLLLRIIEEAWIRNVAVAPAAKSA